MSQSQMSEVRTSQRDPGLEQRILTFKATYVVWLLFGLLEALLAFRIGLKFIGANPNNAFAAFIYGATGIFVLPFAGLVGTPVVGAMVLEISSIIAMMVYALVGWGVERLVWVIFYRPRTAVVNVTQTTTDNRRTP